MTQMDLRSLARLGRRGGEAATIAEGCKGGGRQGGWLSRQREPPLFATADVRPASRTGVERLIFDVFPRAGSAWLSLSVDGGGMAQQRSSQGQKVCPPGPLAVVRGFCGGGVRLTVVRRWRMQDGSWRMEDGRGYRSRGTGTGTATATGTTGTTGGRGW